MANLDFNSIRRGLVFIPVIFMVYMCQFLFIYLQVVLRGQELASQGELFVIYSFFNVIYVMIKLNELLYYGSETNRLDGFI